MFKAKNYCGLEAVSSYPSSHGMCYGIQLEAYDPNIVKSDYSVSWCMLYAIVSFRSQVFYDYFTNINVFNILYI
jgi:hypothetical protein